MPRLRRAPAKMMFYALAARYAVQPRRYAALVARNAADYADDTRHTAHICRRLRRRCSEALPRFHAACRHFERCHECRAALMLITQQQRAMRSACAAAR